MNRCARYVLVSEADIYHITSRGAGRRIVFEDDADRLKYMELLVKFITQEKGELFAWCLMDNHIHLLIRLEIHALSTLMRRLNTSYAQYFNGKHGHVGPVFQGRFDSNPINTDEHLMLCVAYIHRNPKDIGDGNWRRYRWSSYSEYFGNELYCNTKFVLGVFGGIESFRNFHDSNDVIAEVDFTGAKKRLSDAEAKAVLVNLLGDGYSDVLHLMGKPQRDSVLARLFYSNLSARQIERLTGIGRNIVANAIRET